MEMLNVDRAAAYLRTADDCLIYIHTNPDGDAVGSGGALALALRRLGKRARVFCADEISERLRFLTEAAADVPFTRTQDASATPLSVDVASAGQLGVSEAPHFALSIDHHAVNRIGCERLLLKSDYPAAGEIVYELLCALGLPLDRPLATLLYAAISSPKSTGCCSRPKARCRPRSKRPPTTGWSCTAAGSWPSSRWTRR